jgi:chromosome segregation ATPase
MTEVLDFLREKFTRLDGRFDAVQNDLLAMRNDVRVLKEDVSVTASALHRLDTKQDILLDELRALYPQINRMRSRIDALEES